MAITHVATTTSTSNLANVSANVPTGTTTDDYIIAIAANDWNVMSPVQTGWTAHLALSSGPGGNYMGVWGRRVVAGGASSYSWDTAGADGSLILTTKRGQHLTSPIDALGVAQNNASSTNAPAQGISTSYLNSALIYAGIVNGDKLWTQPTGWSERADLLNTAPITRLTQMDFIFTTGGSTGTITPTLATAGPTLTFLMALRAADGAAFDTTAPNPPTGVTLTLIGE